MLNGAGPQGDIKVRNMADAAHHLNDHETRIRDLEAISVTVEKVWRLLKWATPMMIGALLASGTITGPLAEALRFLADHWSK